MVRSAEDEEGDGESGLGFLFSPPTDFPPTAFAQWIHHPPLVSKGFSTPDQELDSPKIGRRKVERTRKKFFRAALRVCEKISKNGAN